VPLNFRPLPRDYLPLEAAIEPKLPADREKLVAALERMASQDPGFRTSIDGETGQARLHMESEDRLEAAVEAFAKAGIDVNVGALQIAYREMLSASVEGDYTYKKQIGSAGQFARVKLCFEPSQRSMSNTFINSIVSGAVPSEFVPAVEKGFRAVADSGPLLGFPMVACRATLLDGAHHDVDSSPLAFEIATRAAFREAASQVAINLLEPYLEIDITTPETFAATVVADFKSRRGVNTAKEVSPAVIAIYGFAPLANLFGYEKHLKSITQDRSAYSWKLAGLEEVPTEEGKPPFAPAAAKRG
jgi:elongation factor G